MEAVINTQDPLGSPYGVGDLKDHLLVMLILYRLTQDFLALYIWGRQGHNLPELVVDLSSSLSEF